MVNSVEAVLQARKVYKDLHQAYDVDKVSKVLSDWLEENHTLAYESNMALEELNYLYGSPIMSNSLAQIHQEIWVKILKTFVSSLNLFQVLTLLPPIFLS